MRYAIVTITIGDEFISLSKVTHQSIRIYADKINADFIVIDKCESTPHWEKFQIKSLLNKYDRILYLDTDLIIREDCPNLFNIVPYNQIGAFNEARFVKREYSLIETAQAYDIDPSKINWNGKYYNTGVMLFSKCHKKFLTRPDREFSNFYEQGYLNLHISMEESHRTKDDDKLMFDLSYDFNRMTCLDFCGIERHGSYIIHYAGYHYFTRPGEILDIIKEDLRKWERDSPDFNYKRRIVVIVSGGMGDQVDAEPTLRYMNHIYKDTAEIIITTHWPRLFHHFSNPVLEHKKFIPEKYEPFYKIHTFPDPTTVTYSVISNLLCNTVDYCSVASLQRILPLEKKIIYLETLDEDEKELDDILDGFDLSKAVLIHSGRHWESKSFPIEWWQKIVDIVTEKIPVCLIGTDDHNNRGAYQLNLPDNSFNLIDRTNIGVLISAVSRAPILLSNDSVPVHIAGAFDNWIVVIPTCKHPDHILPYRKCPDGLISSYHKAVALYKKLTLDDCDQRPTTWIEGGATAESKKDSWDVYIHEPEVVAKKVLDIYTSIS
jgi:hypothetical protein